MFGLLIAALLVSSYLTFRMGPLRYREAPRFQGILVVQTVLFDALCGIGIAFIASEDDYRSDGRSRWEVYGGHGWVVGAIAAGLAVAALAALATFRRGRFVALVGPAGLGACVLSYVAFVLNTAN
jgi:hypothetical protein